MSRCLLFLVRRYSRSVGRSALANRCQPGIRVSNNIAHLGRQKEGAKPSQLLSLPPFPGHPLPGKKAPTGPDQPSCHVTAISWIKYYFDEIPGSLIQSHFTKGLIKHSEVMEVGARVHVPISVAEARISKRYDVIPSGTLYPNADEIAYLQRLVFYKDPAILVLNKPPKLPVKGNLPVHNSMDALAAAALSYEYDEGPRLFAAYFVKVHRLDRESSGLHLMGRTEESISHLHLLFSNTKRSKSLSKAWNDACGSTYQRYWALVIGSPKEKEGVISAPLTKVLLDDGRTERVMLAQHSGLEAFEDAVTAYRLLGPMINGCSWMELRPHTSRKHQLRVHCAEALGTPIVGDYKYGWFVHRKWKQMPRVDVEPTTGKPYRLKRPEGLDVQKGSVLSKVPLLHLHSRELVLPNIAKFIELHSRNCLNADYSSKPDLLRFVAPMPSHMKISWKLMSSFLAACLFNKMEPSLCATLLMRPTKLVPTLFLLFLDSVARSNHGATIASGFGGLRLEGIVGIVESLGASSEPPGEGNRGVISGESAESGGEDVGGFGSNAGAAEILEAGGRLASEEEEEEERERDWEIKKIMSGMKNGFVEVEAEAAISGQTFLGIEIVKVIVYFEVYKQSTFRTLESYEGCCRVSDQRIWFHGERPRSGEGKLKGKLNYVNGPGTSISPTANSHQHVDFS
ncbi:RNA pseudouridine synthase 3, mitochondrial [Capsicum annuum]|nr:RNA pseudouridine synthase 3, mitochondrial [Capsicum annuum]